MQLHRLTGWPAVYLVLLFVSEHRLLIHVHIYITVNSPRIWTLLLCYDIGCPPTLLLSSDPPRCGCFLNVAVCCCLFVYWLYTKPSEQTLTVLRSRPDTRWIERPAWGHDLLMFLLPSRERAREKEGSKSLAWCLSVERHACILSRWPRRAHIKTYFI